MSNRGTPAKAIAGKPLALIAGPTASGKSDLAVRLALGLEREAGRKSVIVNADSAQVYADLRVLSARPSDEEMQGVPHALFGAWDASRACSAADWASAAREVIASAHADGAVPILVGGTGLYIRTLLDGIAPVPPIDEGVREVVRALETQALHEALLAEDTAAAARIAPADRQRLARALEVVRSTGRPLALWQQEKSGGIAADVTLAPLVLLPEREALYRRCDARFAAMLEHGAVPEVERLLARGLDPALPAMNAIGVPQIADWLAGRSSQTECLASGQQATRNYAKRQYTWLRHQPPAHWPRCAPENVVIATHFEILFRD